VAQLQLFPQPPRSAFHCCGDCPVALPRPPVALPRPPVPQRRNKASELDCRTRNRKSEVGNWKWCGGRHTHYRLAACTSQDTLENVLHTSIFFSSLCFVRHFSRRARPGGVDGISAENTTPHARGTARIPRNDSCAEEQLGCNGRGSRIPPGQPAKADPTMEPRLDVLRSERDTLQAEVGRCVLSNSRILPRCLCACVAVRLAPPIYRHCVLPWFLSAPFGLFIIDAGVACSCFCLSIRLPPTKVTFALSR
jgi:hypothetical protein